MAYTNEEIETTFNSICLEIEKGRPIRQILKDSNMPSTTSFYKWLEDSKKLYIYSQAIDNDKYKDNTKCKLNPEGSRAKNNSDYRVVNARKTNLKKFGKSGYLYVIRIVDTNLVKIGYSQKPKRRLRDIEAVLPYDIETIYLNYLENALFVEMQLHESFKKNNKKREWFEIDNIDYLNKKIDSIVNDWTFNKINKN